MLVNYQKSGCLGQGCVKDCTHTGSVCVQNLYVYSLYSQTLKKTAFRNNHTEIWVGEMLRNHLERMQPSHVPKASCPDTTRQGDRNQEPEPATGDAYEIEVSDHNSISS